MEIKSEDEEKDWSEFYFFVWGNQMKIFVLKTWCKLFSIDLFCKDAKFTKSILCGQLVSCKREIIISKSKFIINLWYMGLLGQRLSHIREWKSREEDNVLWKRCNDFKISLTITFTRLLLSSENQTCGFIPVIGTLFCIPESIWTEEPTCTVISNMASFKQMTLKFIKNHLSLSTFSKFCSSLSLLGRCRFPLLLNPKPARNTIP